MTKRPLALIILDGWGYSPHREGNAIALAHTPFYDEISAKYPKTLLEASGVRVGLPADAPGNSEIGHLSIGAGRVVRTEVSAIKSSLKDGSFFENEVLKNAFSNAGSSNASVHLIGLLSDGDINSSQETLFALLRSAKKYQAEKVFIHCILDGYDVSPRTADVYIEALEIKAAEIGIGKIATLCGRRYAMDKDQNWERTARAYTMLVHAEGERATDPVKAVRNSFLRGINDEFIQPIVLENARGMPEATIKDGDTVIFFNHRGDRMRQLVKVLSVNESDEANRIGKPKTHTVCLTEYDRAFGLPVAFPLHEQPNVLAQVFADRGILNCRITETNKYQYLTYFFNGGVELEHPCEQRVMIQPQKQLPEIQSPESGSFKITDRLLRGLEAGENDVFVINLPAADIAAHGGNLNKTIEAIQFIDTCLGGILKKIRELKAVGIITADHGNCEKMIDPDTGERFKEHSDNPVPFHLIDEYSNGVRLRTDGALEDIAPTILGILGIPKPDEMTGRDLRIYD